MTEFSLVASATFAFDHASKDVPSALRCEFRKRRDIIKSVEDQSLSKNLLLQYNDHQGLLPIVEQQALINFQDAGPDSFLCYGIATRLTDFFLSDEEGMDIDLLGSRTVAIDDPCDMFCDSHFWLSTSKFYVPSHLVLLGSKSEIKGLTSFASEFNTKKSFTTGKQAMVVPYFRRWRGGHARTGSLKSSITQTNSLASVKQKPHPKKNNRKKGASGREVYYEKNYLRACEALLSVAVGRNGAAVALLSPRRSGPEVAQLLSRLASWIAGAGLAVLLLSAAGRASPGSARGLSMGLGLGLFWLAVAVNNLCDVVGTVGKPKPGPLEEDVAVRVGKRVDQVVLRAAALLGMALLRFM